jgi:hypothetical protein
VKQAHERVNFMSCELDSCTSTLMNNDELHE